MGSPPSRLLLTVLGKDPKEATYRMGDPSGGTVNTARLAPLALLDLLPEENRPDRVLALCTPEAKEGSWLLLKEALGDSCEVVDVPTGLTNQDVQGFLDVLVDAIFKEGEKVELIVDITHGFRHFSFLVYYES